MGNIFFSRVLKQIQEENRGFPGVFSSGFLEVTRGQHFVSLPFSGSLRGDGYIFFAWFLGEATLVYTFSGYFSYVFHILRVF